MVVSAKHSRPLRTFATALLVVASLVAATLVSSGPAYAAGSTLIYGDSFVSVTEFGKSELVRQGYLSRLP